MAAKRATDYFFPPPSAPAVIPTWRIEYAVLVGLSLLLFRYRAIESKTIAPIKTMTIGNTLASLSWRMQREANNNGII